MKISFLLPFLLLLAPLALSAGPWPEEIARWSEAEKTTQRAAGANLQAELADAIKNGKTQYTIPPGNYRFAQPFPGSKGAAILFNGVKEFTLDGKGANFFVEWLPSGYALTAILILNGSSHITVRGITIDWDPVPFTQGRIVKTFKDKPNEVLFKPDAGWTIPPVMKLPHDKLPPDGGGMRSYLWDPSTKKLLPQVRMTLMDPSHESSYTHPEPDGSYRLSFGNSPNGSASYRAEQIGLHLGATIVSHYRGPGTAFWIWDAGPVTIEDVTIYSSPNIVIKGKKGEGGYVFRRIQAIRRPGTDRLMVSNADGFQLNQFRRGPLVEDCVFEGIGDDFINLGEVELSQEPNSGGIIRCNTFTSGIVRGILARTNNLLIEGNRVTNTLEAALAIQETAAISQLVIRGNSFEDNCARMISGVGHVPFTSGATIEMFDHEKPADDPIRSDILIEGNTIVQPRGSAVSVRSADRVRIINNTFDGCGSFPWTGRGRQPEHYGRPVGIYERATHIEVRDNQVINTGPYSLDQ